MYDSAFITQFPTLYKNTQERHVSGGETWAIGSVLEGERGGGQGGRLRGEGAGEGRSGRVQPPPPQRVLSDKPGHPGTQVTF